MNIALTSVSHGRRLTLSLLLALLPAATWAGDVQAWLIRNPGSPETVMSTDAGEKDRLLKEGWLLGGTGLLHSEVAEGTGSLHRMVRASEKDVSRMLAVTPTEVAVALKAGYVTEGELGFVALQAGPGLAPVYRYSKGGKLLWLISAADRAWAKKDGWKEEKVAFLLWPVAKE